MTGQKKILRPTFIVNPPLKSDIHIGTDGTGTNLYLGRLAETGRRPRVDFGGGKEFVTLILGKRGSGKSHSLGVLVEGLATVKNRTSISAHDERRAVLLLDPMGNFWTTAHKVARNGPDKVKRQFASLDGWNLEVEDLEVRVYLPAGFKTRNDPDMIREFRVRVADLSAPDLADLLSVNLLSDPQGALLDEAFAAVVEDGWEDDDVPVPANPEYSFKDILAYLDWMRDGNRHGDHSPATIRALSRSIRRLSRSSVFSGEGTPLPELLEAGRLGVLMLPHRVGADLRRVITRLLIRRILREREEAANIRQRLDIEVLPEEERQRLERELEQRPPRSVLALDEAQELLGGEGKEARKALEDFCLLGRNYGLSLLLATQRPGADAISRKVKSQVDLYLVHRLLTQDDIDICRQNLLATYPDEVRLGNRDLDFTELVRSLHPGQAIVVPSHAHSDGEMIKRVLVVDVRPRISVHGGEVE